MTSVSAFNDMMEQFLEELVQTFPDEPAMKKYQASFDLLRKANARVCLENFMHGVNPYAQYIMAKNDAFFLEHSSEMEFLNDLNIKKVWTPELSTNTKDAIWQYIQTLYILGTTISALPEDTLNMIEQVAQKCANELDPNALDPNALMAAMSGMLGKSLDSK